MKIEAWLVVALLLASGGPGAAAQCELTELLASDKAAGAEFGFAVGIDGETSVVAAYRDSSTVPLAGAAYVFERQQGVWTETAKLMASDPDVMDRFGDAVAIDGDTIVIGSRYDQDAGYGTGAVYTYDRIDGVWTFGQELTASDMAQSTLFGQSVDIDGDRIVVGAESGHGEVLPQVNIGSVYIFERTAGVWSQVDKVWASDYATQDRFGVSVDLEDDRLLVGSRQDDDNGTDSGSAYVYEHDGSGWVESAKLLASDGLAADQFGRDVALEGDVAVIGALVGDGVVAQSGAAYVFEHDGSGWAETAKLAADDGENGDFFGTSVALSGDTVAVGAWADDDGGSQAGAAYVFERQGSKWPQTRKLLAGSTAPLEFFGHDVALDGRNLLVGSKDGQDENGDDTGAVSVFRLESEALAYGTGCVGSGGFTPEMTLGGCLTPGGDVTLEITQGLGSSTVLVVFGVTPGALVLEPSGCTLAVDPLLPPILTLWLGGVGPGAGSTTLQGVIPLDVPPATFTMQAFVQDPATAFGWVGTRGLQVTID